MRSDLASIIQSFIPRTPSVASYYGRAYERHLKRKRDYEQAIIAPDDSGKKPLVQKNKEELMKFQTKYVRHLTTLEADYPDLVASVRLGRVIMPPVALFSEDPDVERGALGPGNVSGLMKSC
jgi:hypothetical protein